MSIVFWCGFALLMGSQYRPFTRQNAWAWLVDLVVEVALRGFALALWTPPIFYIVGKYLSRSESRVRNALLWGLGAVPFVVLHTSILWVLVPPYDADLQKFLPRSIHSWLDMIRGGFADQIVIYIAIIVEVRAGLTLEQNVLTLRLHHNQIVRIDKKNSPVGLKRDVRGAAKNTLSRAPTRRTLSPSHISGSEPERFWLTECLSLQ